jgi:hypothetical protein
MTVHDLPHPGAFDTTLVEQYRRAATGVDEMPAISSRALPVGSLSGRDSLRHR